MDPDWKTDPRSNCLMRPHVPMPEESHYRSGDEGHYRAYDRLADFGDDSFTRSQDDPEAGGSSIHQLDRRKQRNYRLIIDPLLKQGPTKVYRFDGHIPGDSTPIVVRDPRSRMARYGTRRDVNLPVPAFKFDENYVGTVLPKEVTFCNLNNNISESFLRDMCKNFGGVIEEATVYYHPKTRRHLGIGTVLFSSTRAARLCADKLHLTSKMGNIMTVYVDNLGQQRRKLVEEATADKPIVRPPSPKSRIQPDPYRQPPLPETHRPHVTPEIHRMPPLPEMQRSRHSSETERGSSWLKSHVSKQFDMQRSLSSVSSDTMGTDNSPNTSLPSTQEVMFQPFPTAPHVHGDFSFSSPLPPPPLPRDLGLSFPPPLQMDVSLPPPPLPVDRGGFNAGRLLPPPPQPGQGYRAPLTCEGPVHFDVTSDCSIEVVTRKSSHNHQSEPTSTSEAYSIGRACREAAAAAASSNPRENVDDKRRNSNCHNGKYSRDDSRSSGRHVNVQNRDDSHTGNYQDSNRDSGRNHDTGRNVGRRDDNRRSGFYNESASRSEEKGTRNFDSKRSGNRRDSHRNEWKGYGRYDDERQVGHRSEDSHSRRNDDSVRESNSHRRNHRDNENRHSHRQRSVQSDVSESRHFHDDNSNSEESNFFSGDWRHDSVSRDGVADHLNNESNACDSVIHGDGIASADNDTLIVPAPSAAPLSLELRIEALLAQSAAVSFLSPDGSESPPKVDDLTSSQPPLPVDTNVWPPPQPPYASEGLPPLPADQVLLPPPPSETPWVKQQAIVGNEDFMSTPSEKCTTEARYVREMTARYNTAVMVDEEDDDRMSLSSLSSGEEKLEVVEHKNSLVNNDNICPPAQLYINHSQNFVNNKLSTRVGSQMMWPTVQSDIGSNGKDMFRPPVAKEMNDLSRFESVLEKVIRELRVVLCRDMQKKMIENTGFKSLEKWFQEKKNNNLNKSSFGNNQPAIQLSEQSKRIPSSSNPLPAVSSSVSLASVATSSSSSKPTAGASDMSAMSLSSLFDRHDSGPFGLGFGSGGLLGLRGAMPKMPSFRKKCQSPVQLPDDVEHEDEEQDEESEQEDDEEAEVEQDNGDSDEEDEDYNEAVFKGPRTPQDSFEEDDNDPKVEDSSADSDSIESEDEEFIPNIRPSKKVIYSSESDEDSVKSDIEDEAMEEGDVELRLPLRGSQSCDDDEEEDITKDESGEAEESSDDEDSEKDEDEEADVDVEAEESEKLSVLSDLGNKSHKLDEHQELDEHDELLEQSEEDEHIDKMEETNEEVKVIEQKELEHVDKITEDEEEGCKMKVVERKDDEHDEHKVKVMEQKKAEHKVKFTVSEDEEGECSDNDDDDDRATITASEEEEEGYDKMKDVRYSRKSLTKKIRQSQSANGDSSSTDSAEESKYKTSLIERRRDKRRGAADLGNRSPTLCLERLAIPSSLTVDTDSSAAEEMLSAGHKQSPADLEHNYFALTQPNKRSRQDSTILPITETDSNLGGDQTAAEQLKPVLTLPQIISLDHCYCKAVSSEEVLEELKKQNTVISPIKTVDEIIKSPKTSRAQKSKRGGLSDVTNVTINRELSSILTPVVRPPRPRFERRDYGAELVTLFKFLITGADAEDIAFLRQRYEQLLQLDSVETDWVNEIHWVDHPITCLEDLSSGPPPRKRRKHGALNDEVTQHLTGCARTEGYYKISHQEKCNYLSYTQGVQNSDQAGGHGGSKGAGEQLTEADAASQTKKKVQQSREARSESRRWQSVLSSLGEDYGDLLKFNQLKFRKKQLKFARSGIHDWGLFAQEQIAEGEMVIEYVGQVVRQSVADLREKRYEAVGIGSSYLFRVDGEAIVDATRYGNLARFINHSCNPNCYAKIVTVESQKKIVIYSRREINMNEEITYDYKFPIEDNKIPCFCGAPGCRGSLN